MAAAAGSRASVQADPKSKQPAHLLLCVPARLPSSRYRRDWRKDFSGSLPFASFPEWRSPRRANHNRPLKLLQGLLQFALPPQFLTLFHMLLAGLKPGPIHGDHVGRILGVSLIGL